MMALPPFNYMQVTERKKMFKKTVYCVALLLVPIVIFFPGWNFDDTGFWLATFKYKPFTFSYFTQDRFCPLNVVSSKLLSYLSFSPLIFFIYNYFLALLSISMLLFLFFKVFPHFRNLPLLVLLTSGFATTYYRIFHGERELLFLWTLFMLIVVIYIKNGLIKSTKWVSLAAIPAILALYFKETSFIILVSFSLTMLGNYYITNRSNKLSITGRKQITQSIIPFLYFLLIAAVLYLIHYFSSTKPIVKTGYFVSLTPKLSIVDRLSYSMKASFLYLISDPLLVLVLPTLLVITNIVSHRSKIDKQILNRYVDLCIVNAFAIGALALVFAYIALGIQSNYYLLPAYPFGIFAIAGYLNILYSQKVFFFNTIIKRTAIITISIFVLNSIISGLNEIYFQRLASNNFMRYNAALTERIREKITENNLNKKVRMFMPGKDDISYIAGIQKDYFKFYGIDTGKIEIVSTEARNNFLLQNSSLPSVQDFGVHAGDLFLLTPNSTISQDQILSNLHDIKLKKIIQTKSEYYFELPEIRHLMKYMLLKKGYGSIGAKMVFREVDFGLYEVLN